MSKSFTDSVGRTWVCDVDVSALRRCRSRLGVDLATAATDPQKIGPIIEDPVALADVLYCVLEPKLTAQGVSDDAFGAALAGEIIIAARDALLAGLIDFFPQPQRDVLALAIGKARQIEETILGRLRQAVQSGDLEQALDAAMRKELTSGESSTGQQEPVE